MIMSQGFEKKVEYYRKYIDKALALQLRAVSGGVLREAIAHVAQAGGKRIRPILTLLSCEATGGKIEDALPAAVAMETLHTFTLVHDDIMDNTALRRGVQTVHAKWDSHTALLTGDTIAALAIQSLARCTSPNVQRIFSIFADAFRDVCIGQAMDKELESRDADKKKYMEMIGKKTAALFSASTAIGACIGASDESMITALTGYGKELGIAFQIRDDTLDIVTDNKKIGKDIGSDIREGKKTFLYITAEKNAHANDAPLLQKYAVNKGLRGRDVDALLAVYERSHSVETAEKEIRRHTRRAIAQAESLPESNARGHLISMVENLSGRVY